MPRSCCSTSRPRVSMPRAVDARARSSRPRRNGGAPSGGSHTTRRTSPSPTTSCTSPTDGAWGSARHGRLVVDAADGGVWTGSLSPSVLFGGDVDRDRRAAEPEQIARCRLVEEVGRVFVERFSGDRGPLVLVFALSLEESHVLILPRRGRGGRGSVH